MDSRKLMDSQKKTDAQKTNVYELMDSQEN